MPELPEIKRISESLNRKIQGQRLDKIIVTKNSKFYKSGKLYSSTYDIIFNEEEQFYYLDCESICNSVHQIGKKIIFNFGEDILVSSCGMNGHWGYTQTLDVALVLIFESFCVFYNDYSDQGNFSAVNRNSPEYLHIFKDVGIDIMSDIFTLEKFTEIITNRKISNLNLCDFLIEQKYIAGIGNYLRSDIMYIAELSPFRKLKELDIEEIENLYNKIVYICNESYSKGGFTLQSYSDPEGNVGYYSPKIYKKTKDFYGNNVEIFEKSGKKIYYSPTIQI